MYRVGELLKRARIAKKIEILAVERETKIKSAFIKALEEGEYSKLPAPPYVRGFLKNYAQFLGLDTQVILALFRREYDAETENKLLPAGLGKIPPRRIRVTWIALLLIILSLLFLSYFFFQYKSFFGSPSLEVSTPHNYQMVEGDSVLVTGKTDPDSQLLINNKIIALARDGSFRETIPVFRGDFTITVIAKNRFGRESKITRVVKVQ